MVLGEGHIPEHRTRLHHLHRLILEGVAPGSIHPDLWREGRRAEVSSDPALLAVELQPRDPPTARAEAVSSVSTVPRGQAQKSRSDTAHHGLMLGMAKRGDWRTTQRFTKTRSSFLWFPVAQVSFGEEDGAGSGERVWDWGTVDN